jgi:transcription termination factor Rho
MNILNINKFKNVTYQELEHLAKELNIPHPQHLKTHELMLQILQCYVEQGMKVIGSGILEIMPDGFGFLRSEKHSYALSPHDIYISPNMIRKYYMRTGDDVVAEIRLVKDKSRYIALKQIDSINNKDPKELSYAPKVFENLTSEYACKRLVIEMKGNMTLRVIDLAAPIGLGQRGLIVSPPKAGKTTVMRNMALSVVTNNPECKLINLLIGERPEEVTEIKKMFKDLHHVDIIASTFDDPVHRHLQLAEMALERAKRLVENGEQVVILLDSLTRLARSYNEAAPSNGKLLSGGVDAQALQKAKKFFGAARNTSEGGSLTIIATVLVETGSKMDDIIFEEFKSTGNMEIFLNRKLAERQIFPAISFSKSGTRREDLIMSANELQKMKIIRKLLSDMEDGEAIEFLTKQLQNYETNSLLFAKMNKI